MVFKPAGSQKLFQIVCFGYQYVFITDECIKEPGNSLAPCSYPGKDSKNDRVEETGKNDGFAAGRGERKVCAPAYYSKRVQVIYQ
jgi:hypothetical protein